MPTLEMANKVYSLAPSKAMLTGRSCPSLLTDANHISCFCIILAFTTNTLYSMIIAVERRIWTVCHWDQQKEAATQCSNPSPLVIGQAHKQCPGTHCQIMRNLPHYHYAVPILKVSSTVSLSIRVGQCTTMPISTIYGLVTQDHEMSLNQQTYPLIPFCFVSYSHASACSWWYSKSWSKPALLLQLTARMVIRILVIC